MRLINKLFSGVVLCFLFAVPSFGQTSFKPPYAKAGAPVDKPAVFKIGSTSLTTVQVATSTAATGVVTFHTNATASVVKILKIGPAIGVVWGATAAYPWLQACFEPIKAQQTAFEFNYDFAFDENLTGVRGIADLAASGAGLQVVGEVFDNTGASVGSNFSVIANDAFNPLPGAVNKRLYKAAGKLSVPVPIVLGKTYYWKFTVDSILYATAHSKKTPVSGSSDEVAPPAVGGQFILNNVVATPPVAPTPCP